MNIDIIKKIAIAEVNSPTFEVTKQFLKVNKLVYENSEPKIVDIIIDEKQEGAEVYFQIENEKYFFVVFLDLKPEISLRFMDMSAGNKVSLLIVSESLNLSEILKNINIEPNEKWEKGALVSNQFTESYEKNSGIIFKPIEKTTGNVEDKIEVILSKLESSKNLISNLSSKCIMEIQVAYFGYKDQMWGINLNPVLIKKIGEFNFSLDIDLYASGQELEDIEI